MVNYDALPLFPLQVVLFPGMPLPLHIFEPRYREMIQRCREEKSRFGVTLIQSGSPMGAETIPHRVGTTARITQCEEMPDGCLNILVFGETRFRVTRTRHDQPYLTAQAEPLWEQTADPLRLQSPFDAVVGLFKLYLKSLFALSGRSLSTLHLPQEPESLSYAVASVLQVPPMEKQCLLEMTDTELRLLREVELLQSKIAAQDSLPSLIGLRSEGEGDGLICPADTQELGKLASLN